jgi:D-alanyl-D-alanine carboxypeptidase
MVGLVEAFDRIGTALEYHLGSSHAAGAAIAVTDTEQILGVAVRGMAEVGSRSPVRPETRFQIGSISKSFAAIVALQEAEAGSLDLHVSVNELLPWLELAEPFGPITLHHLLSHTAGLRTGTEDAPTGLGAAVTLRETPPTFTPGERFWYSNDGYKLVGLTLERITGIPIEALLRARIFEPLDMTASVAAITDDVRTELATGYEPMFADRPPRLTHPLMPAQWLVSNTADGSIVSNVVDVCAYARLLLSRGAGPRSRPLSEDGFERLTRPVVADPDEPGASYAYGLNVGSDEHGPWFAHGGGMVGHTGLLAVEPASGLAAAVLQNGGGSKKKVLAYTLDAVRAALAGDEPPEPWSPPAATEIPDAESFAGCYEARDGRALDVEAVDDGLRVKVGTVSARVERDPLLDPGDTFLVADPGLERHPLRFARDAAGRVVEAFHGDAWFHSEVYAGPEPEAPPSEWLGFPGLYRSDNPWSPVLRVLLRKGRLAIEWPAGWGDEEGGTELTPLEDGSFAVGETWTPRRIRFDRIVEGKAVVVAFNAGRWFRSFEE